MLPHNFCTLALGVAMEFPKTVILDFYSRILPKKTRIRYDHQAIFLCGGRMDSKKRTVRKNLFPLLEAKVDKVYLAENVTASDASEDFKQDLLTLENYFAALVPKVVLILESEGAIAEFGTFVNDPTTREKIFLVIFDRFFEGPEANSFIRKGPVKFFLQTTASNPSLVPADNRPYYVLDYDYSTSDILDLAESISDYKSVKNPVVKWDYEYHYIFILLDIIKLLVVAERSEIGSIFHDVMVSLVDNFSKKNVPVEDMLEILRRFNLIVTVSRGDKTFMLAQNNIQSLDYQFSQEEDPAKSANFPKQRKSIESNIYSDKANRSKAALLKKFRETGKGGIEWLLPPSLTSSERFQLVASAPFQYKVFSILKRNGKKREISQPTAKLKILQRECLLEISSKLKIHDAATAYRKGKNGILENARIHQNSRFFAKFDFTNFFPSLTASDFLDYSRTHNITGTHYDDLDLLRIFFKFNKKTSNETARIDVFQTFGKFGQRPDKKHIILEKMVEDYPNEFGLAIGAPSSPSISNAMMFAFDDRMAKVCGDRGMRYSRYADDLTISSSDPFMIDDIENEIIYATSASGLANLILNKGKTKYLSFANRVSITGLIITPQNRLSLGRNRKRKILSELNRFDKKLGFGSKDWASLKGWLALSKSLEPDFFQHTVDKFGQTTIDEFVRTQDKPV